MIIKGYIFNMIEAFTFYLTHIKSLGEKARNDFVIFWRKCEQKNLLLRFTDLILVVSVKHKIF